MPGHSASAPALGSPSMRSLEKENELRQFLMLARPEWSVPRKRGHSDIARVLVKLRAIGVTDVETLFQGIDNNSINEELHRQGCVRFSREAINAIRGKRAMLQTLKDVAVPQVRQIGPYSPVSQMLSHRRLADVHQRSAGGTPSSRRLGGFASCASDGYLRLGSLSSTGTLGHGPASLTGTARGLDSVSMTEEEVISSEGEFGSCAVPRLRGTRHRVRRRTALPALEPLPASAPSAVGRRGPIELPPLVDPPASAAAAAAAAAVVEPDGNESSAASTVGLTEPSDYSPKVPGRRGRAAFASGDSQSNGGGAGSTASTDSPGRRTAAGDRWPAPGGADARPPRRTSGMRSSTLGGSFSSVAVPPPEPSLHSKDTSYGATGGSVAEALTVEEVEQVQRAGAQMLRSGERAVACWSCLRSRSPLQLGEEMLAEQASLDDRQRLIRTVSHSHGEEVGFRGHVARNIRGRLQEESRREAGRGPALAVDQQCINIKKQLDLMVKARGELRSLRFKVQAFCEGDDEEAELAALRKKEKEEAEAAAKPKVPSPQPTHRGPTWKTHKERNLGEMLSRTVEWPERSASHK